MSENGSVQCRERGKRKPSSGAEGDDEMVSSSALGESASIAQASTTFINSAPDSAQLH